MFEIKIAFVGYVSVGKSTIINALFQDKFTEVALSRTTAGISYFQIHNSSSKTKNNKDATRNANSILKEIEQDNKLLRESGQVKETVFHIKLDKPLCKMRDDTTLVLVDIPGINEAETSNIYREYVSDKWDTFDCVVVVMDALQGVNTEEQVGLLKFVKQNNDEKKQVPIIVLANKFDDPDDEEQQIQVNDAKEKVMSIFETYSRKSMSGRSSLNLKPEFIPISARNAFLYRCAGRLTFEEFKRLSREMIDRLGREEVGKIKWKRLTPKKQFEVAYGAVSKESEYKERLAGTNFDKLLSVLCDTVGGTTKQSDLIAFQHATFLRKLSPESSDIVDILCKFHSEFQHLGKSSDNLAKEFWRLYELSEANALEKLEEYPHVHVLAKPMKELLDYLKLIEETKWDKVVDVVSRMKDLVGKQLGLIIKKSKVWNMKKSYSGNVARLKWKDLNAIEWSTIIGSVLLLSYNQNFCFHFGREKLILEHLQIMSSICACTQPKEQLECSYCGVTFSSKDATCPNRCNRGSRVRTNFNNCKLTTNELANILSTPLDRDDCRIEQPELLSDPSHWGHVAWLCCEKLGLLESEIACFIL